MKSIDKKTVLITKNQIELKNDISEKSFEKFNFIFLPTIITTRKQLSCDELKFVTDYQNFDWIIFSSINAVEYFFQIIKIEEFRESKIKIAVVGEKTKNAVISKNLKVEICPNNFSQEGLIEEFSKININLAKILIPTSAQSRTKLKIELENFGAEVKRICIYKTSTNLELRNTKIIHKLRVEKPNIFIFTSPTSFYGFLELINVEIIEEYFKNSEVISIGHITSEAIQKENVQSQIISEKYTIKSIINKLVKRSN
jgi:uroporphyrinogen-III synthase